MPGRVHENDGVREVSVQAKYANWRGKWQTVTLEFKGQRLVFEVLPTIDNTKTYFKIDMEDLLDDSPKGVVENFTGAECPCSRRIVRLG